MGITSLVWYSQIKEADVARELTPLQNDAKEYRRNLGNRLMVGHRPLEASIGVRVPVSQQCVTGRQKGNPTAT